MLSEAGETKSILRHAMRGFLPAEVLFRRDKVGFEAPDIQWLRRMSDHAPALTEGLENIRWIDKQVVDNQLQEVLDGKREYDNFCWRMASMAKWSKLFTAFN